MRISSYVPRSLGSRFIKGTDEYLSRWNLVVSLMLHFPLACEYNRFPLLLAARDVSRGGKYAT